MSTTTPSIMLCPDCKHDIYQCTCKASFSDEDEAEITAITDTYTPTRTTGTGTGTGTGTETETGPATATRTATSPSCVPSSSPHPNNNHVASHLPSQRHDDDWEAADDSDDDEMKPALAIDEEEEGEGDGIQVDDDTEDGPPMTAEQYLRQVRREAGRLPAVVVAHSINPRAYDHQQTVTMPTVQTLPPCPSSFLPDPSWLDSYGQRFADERQALIRYAAIQRKKQQKQRIAAAQASASPPTPPTPSFPLLTDHSAWLSYVLSLGQPTLHIMTHMDQITTRGVLYVLFGYIHRYVKAQGKRKPSDASDPSDERHNQDEEEEDKEEPDEKTAQPNESHSIGIESKSPAGDNKATTDTSSPAPPAASIPSCPPSDFLTRQLSLWLYALLLRLDKPIHAEMASLLCQGYRDIATLRAAQSSPSSPCVIHGNLLLGIIDKCYGQRVV